MNNIVNESKGLPNVTLCSFTTHDITGLAVAIGAPIILGFLAGSHVRKFKDLYHRDVIKPRFIPPRWLFAPVWGILYFLMGYASYLIYMTGKLTNTSTVRPLSFYALQLALNLCWPALFFRYRNPKVALFILTSTLITASVTTYKFYDINREAGLIMVPYLVWLLVGGYINKVIWRLNQENPKLTKRKLFSYPDEAAILQAKIDVASEALKAKKAE